MFRQTHRGVARKATPKARRNWRAWIIAALVVLSVSAMLIVPVLTLGPRHPDTRAAAQRQPEAGEPSVPVPVQAAGSMVLSLALGGALAVAQVRARPRRKDEVAAE